MQKNILISKKTAKKIIAARQKAIQKEKAEKYWDTGRRMCGCKTDGNRGCQNWKKIKFCMPYFPAY